MLEKDNQLNFIKSYTALKETYVTIVVFCPLIF